MTIIVAIDLIHRRFRGRAAAADRTAWPPSPARLIGALLAGAHALDGADPDHPSGRCLQAREALTELCRAELPVIAAPAAPVEFDAHPVVWYAHRHPIGDQLGETLTDSWDTGHALRGKDIPMRTHEPAPGCHPFNRVPKPRTTALLPHGGVLRYVIDTDIVDPQRRQALVEAAAAVPFFGTSLDQCAITIEWDERRSAEVVDELIGQYRAEGGAVWSPVPAGGRTLRGWSADTLQFFDAIHAYGGVPVTADFRVPDRQYGHYRTRRTELEEPATLTVLPFRNGPTSLRDFSRIVGTVAAWGGGAVLPAVEFHRADRVRGIIAYGAGRDAALRAGGDILTTGERAPYSALQARTWAGPAPRWMSATPIAADRDPIAAHRHISEQLAEHGLMLTRMTQLPWLHWQTRRLDVGPRYGLWFVTAGSSDGKPVSGPLRIGACAGAGAGLLTPQRFSSVQKDTP